MGNQRRRAAAARAHSREFDRKWCDHVPNDAGNDRRQFVSWIVDERSIGKYSNGWRALGHLATMAYFRVRRVNIASVSGGCWLISDVEARSEIARAFGSALDDLVHERMKGLVEEPDITSRIGQRLEERFDGKVLRGYRVRVITETIPSHGAQSLEKPLGTDLYFAISVEDGLGNTTTKGVLVQAKRRDKLDWTTLEEQCRRMNMVTKKGSVVWIYTQSGIDVVRSVDVPKRSSAAFGVDKLFDRVFECELGDRRKVPSGPLGDRGKLKEMIEALGAKNAVWLDLERK
jgi:hypothetical protein